MRVELHPAWFWRCLRCEAQNYSACAVIEKTDADAEQAVRKSLGLDEWQDIPEGVGGEFYTKPTSVTCIKCGEAFGVAEEEAPQ